MPSSAPAILDAVELRFPGAAGTNNVTYHLVAVANEGTRYDLVVKPKLEVSQCFNEWVAAELARKLGIRVPASFAVSISPEFVASLTRERAHFTPNSIVFGSERFTGYLPPQHPLKKELSTEALRLLLFDVLIQNADRRLQNPNFQVRSDGLVAFDHELIWSNRFVIGDAKHDALGMLHNHWCSKESFSAPTVRAQATWLATLDDGEIDSTIEAGAVIWPVPYAEEIATGLKKRRDSAPDWLARLIEWLQNTPTPRS